MFDPALYLRYKIQTGDIVELVQDVRNGHGLIKAGRRGLVTEILGGANHHVHATRGGIGWTSHQMPKFVPVANPLEEWHEGQRVIMIEAVGELLTGEIVRIASISKSHPYFSPARLESVDGSGRFAKAALADRRVELVKVGTAVKEYVASSDFEAGSRVKLRYALNKGDEHHERGKRGIVERHVGMMGRSLLDITFDDGSTTWAEPILLVKCRQRALQTA